MRHTTLVVLLATLLPIAARAQSSAAVLDSIVITRTSSPCGERRICLWKSFAMTRARFAAQLDSFAVRTATLRLSAMPGDIGADFTYCSIRDASRRLVIVRFFSGGGLLELKDRPGCSAGTAETQARLAEFRAFQLQVVRQVLQTPRA